MANHFIAQGANKRNFEFIFKKNTLVEKMKTEILLDNLRFYIKCRKEVFKYTSRTKKLTNSNYFLS